MTTEDDALDSYQNLLFSVARFHEYTGRYPKKITVVGYEMKRRRFEELHRAAIRWPEDKFHYIGIDAEGEQVALAREGEVSASPSCTRRDAFSPSLLLIHLMANHLRDALLTDNAKEKNGYLPYLHDTYGCHDVLLAKRRARNQGARFHPYFTSAPELAGLFNWCPNDVNGGQTAVYNGPLPWDRLH